MSRGRSTRLKRFCFRFQLAFRSTQAMLSQKKEQVKRLLFYPTPSGSAHVELEASICTYLRRTVDTFDLTQCIEVTVFSNTNSGTRFNVFPLKRRVKKHWQKTFKPASLPLTFLFSFFFVFAIVSYRKWALNFGRRCTTTRVWNRAPDSISTSATRCVWLGR